MKCVSSKLYWFVISKLKLIKIKKRNLDIKNTSWENSKWWNCSQRQLIQEIAYFSHYPWTASKNSAFFILFFINLFSINKLACMIGREYARRVEKFLKNIYIQMAVKLSRAVKIDLPAKMDRRRKREGKETRSKIWSGCQNNW